MKPTFSAHALQEMERRGIAREMVEAVLDNPQQVLQTLSGRTIYQSQVSFGTEKLYLLRVICDRDPLVVVTVYRTSKITKYWSIP